MLCTLLHSASVIPMAKKHIKFFSVNVCLNWEVFWDERQYGRGKYGIDLPLRKRRKTQTLKWSISGHYRSSALPLNAAFIIACWMRAGHQHSILYKGWCLCTPFAFISKWRVWMQFETIWGKKESQWLRWQSGFSITGLGGVPCWAGSCQARSLSE